MVARTHRLAVVIAAMTLATALVTSGCTASVPKADALQSRSGPAHDARNLLDWAGTYRGTLPCADCPGIETIVTLASDGTYRTRSRYLERSVPVPAKQGRFSWNEAGNTITLDGRQPARKE